MRYKFIYKTICPTMPRTGSRSLASALTILGYRVCHWSPERLSDVIHGKTPNPHFRRYDDVDAILDIPNTTFYREIMAAYPSNRIILTLRNEDEWWASIYKHYIWVRKNLSGTLLDEAIVSQQITFGPIDTNEFLYRKRFREHQEAILNLDLPPDRFLSINICAGEGWDKLCKWLGSPIPDCPFPRIHEER